MQGAVHAVMMQNRLRHLEEMVHNGEVAARQTLLSDPDQLAHATEAARCVASSSQYTQYWRDADEVKHTLFGLLE